MIRRCFSASLERRFGTSPSPPTTNLIDSHIIFAIPQPNKHGLYKCSPLAVSVLLADCPRFLLAADLSPFSLSNRD